jgi:hypothetical protein
MTMAGRRGDWRLDDAEEGHRVDPERFPIPERARRESLRPGDYAKLRFRLVHPAPGRPPAERMWVRVSGVDGHHYLGLLDNRPEAIESLYKGAEIRFGPEHVVEVWEPPRRQPEVRPVAFVNRRLLDDGSLYPTLVCHDPAEEERPPLPDGRRCTGWQLLVGDETPEELDDAENIVLADVASLSERFPAFGRLVAEGEPGRQYRWDAETGAFVDAGAYTPID